MKSRDLLLRCLVQRDGAVWTAICLDFDLAAQGDNAEEAMTHLASQINSYLIDALAGQDKAHAGYLLSRRAPLPVYAKWFFCRAVNHIDHVWRGAKAFCTVIPMQPQTPFLPA